MKPAARRRESRGPPVGAEVAGESRQGGRQQTGSNRPLESPVERQKDRDGPCPTRDVSIGPDLHVSYDPSPSFTDANYIGVIPEQISHGGSQGFKSPHSSAHVRWSAAYRVILAGPE